MKKFTEKELENYEAVVIGVSAGGLEALYKIIPFLPEEFSLAILIVQHLKADSDDYLPVTLNLKSKIKVKQADEKEKILSGTVYISPPNYHLLVEQDKTLSLSIDAKVNFSRPSVDVLFETAAEVYKEKLIGVILTGASKDGSKGLKAVKNFGGLTIVQNPKTAEVDTMPSSAILVAEKIDYILTLEEIRNFLAGFRSKKNA
ncbi:chemotaxis protein CheB [bacterium]|nr:chemotaxis protein CheB [bacterium]